MCIRQFYNNIALYYFYEVKLFFLVESKRSHNCLKKIIPKLEAE